MKTLIVDDDVELANQLQEALTQQKLSVAVRYSAEEALTALSHETFDLVILDWDLPGADGPTFCKNLRAAGNDVYVIFLTGRGDISSKEAALAAGGDDFLSKPFSVRELQARMRSVARRSPQILVDPLEGAITMGGVHFNLGERIIAAVPLTETGEKAVELTKKEAAVLEYLMRHPDRPMTAQKLLEAVWPSETDSSVESVRTCMMTLRDKLESIGHGEFVKTVVRAGYVIESDS